MTLGKALAGVAGLAAAGVAAGAAWMWLRERASETPEYKVLLADGAFELRRYPAMLVAETVQMGARDRALGNGLGLLADYFFAESRGGEEIAMTTPVIALQDGGGGWRVRLVTPAVWTRETLPEPGPGVTIVEVPSRRVAAVRFAGRADDALLAGNEKQLREWIADQGLVGADQAEHCFFNSPFMPGRMRHNEVMIEMRY
jgi:hypothetical protein